MKNLLLILTFLFAIYQVSAQEEKIEIPTNGWNSGGTIQLLFNQSAFNNEWTGGGTPSIAGNLTLNTISITAWTIFPGTINYWPIMD